MSQVQNSSLIVKWMFIKENAPASSCVLKCSSSYHRFRYINDFIVLLIESSLSLMNFKIRSMLLAIIK